MTIIINEKASINAEGKLNSKHCKPVICIETGEVFTSCSDAAEKNGVHFTVMSCACRGKIKKCNGKSFCYLEDVHEHLDAIVTNIRSMAGKVAVYDAWHAEQEAIRKAEEEKRNAEAKRQAAIEKAKEKIAKKKANCENLESKLMQAEAEYVKAEQELEALLAESETMEEAA